MVTSRLLEAFLACPVKCHLLYKGEVPVGTEYSAWAAAREESYRREGFRKLTSQEAGPDIASTEPALWKYESWRFAAGKTVWTESESGWNRPEAGSRQALPEISGTDHGFLHVENLDLFCIT